MKIFTRLFISKMVANKRLVPVFLSGSFIRSKAVLDCGVFSSFKVTKLLGLKLKKAFSELEKSADSNKKTSTIAKPPKPIRNRLRSRASTVSK